MILYFGYYQKSIYISDFSGIKCKSGLNVQYIYIYIIS